MTGELRRTSAPFEQVIVRGVNYFIGGGLWTNIILVVGGHEPTHPITVPSVEP